MSLDLDDHKAAARPHPSRRWWLGAVAAAVVVVAVVSAVVMWVRGDDGKPSAGSPAPSATAPSSSVAPSSTPSAAQSPAPSAPPAARPRRAFTVAPAPPRCMIPSAALLGQQALAFEGRVTAIHGSAVSLAVSNTLAGRVAPAVVVRQPPHTTEVSVTFRSGHTYLLAASADGSVAGCGFSGEKTPALTRLYATAFGG